MKTLIVLFTTFVVALVVTKIINRNFEIALSARIAMFVMLLFTASAHFALTKGMTMMVPSFMPYKQT